MSGMAAIVFHINLVGHAVTQFSATNHLSACVLLLLLSSAMAAMKFHIIFVGQAFTRIQVIKVHIIVVGHADFQIQATNLFMAGVLPYF